MSQKEDMKKWITLVLTAVIAYCAVNNLNIILGLISKVIGALSPFILGGILAYILNIPMNKIENFINKHRKNKKDKSKVRIVSITLSLILLLFIFLFIAFLLTPELIDNIELLIANIPLLVQKVEEWILNLLDKYPDIQREISVAFKESSNISSTVATLLNHFINSAIGIASQLISSVITLFTAIVFAIYMLSQKEYLQKGITKIIYAYLKKDQADKVMEVGTLANKTFTKFVSGQCVEAVILGIIFFIVLSLFRFPYALIISTLTTITALIPIFGALIAMVIGAILIAVTDPVRSIAFIVVFLVIQQIEGNLIYPKVVGKSVGLSPIWTLLSITVGGSLFGLIGMLVGLPIASILYAILQNDVNKKLKIKEEKI